MVNDKETEDEKSHTNTKALACNYRVYFICLIIRRVLRSARAFCRLITAQTAAGSQPRMVHCSTRQIMPLNILPRSRKDNQGSSMAISVITAKLH